MYLSQATNRESSKVQLNGNFTPQINLQVFRFGPTTFYRDKCIHFNKKKKKKLLHQCRLFKRAK